MTQNKKLLEHNKFERKYLQLMFPIDMEVTIQQEDPVRLASAQLEELDYRKLYRAYSSPGRKSAAEPRVIFEVMVYGSQIGRRENMQYNEQQDCYICAAGRNLNFRRECTTISEHGRFKTMAYYRCENCMDCPHRQACCKAKDDVLKEIRISTELLRLSQQSQINIMSQTGILLRMNRSIQVEVKK